MNLLSLSIPRVLYALAALACTGSTNAEPTRIAGNGVTWVTQQSISADGRYVAFYSYSDNILPGDSNGTADVFRMDLLTSTVILISQNTSGGFGNGISQHPTISANGNLIAFDSQASNLITGDTNTIEDVFVRNVSAGTTTRISLRGDGGQITGTSTYSYPLISADGNKVLFYSFEPLVPEDTDSESDVYLRDLTANTTRLVSVDDAGNPSPKSTPRGTLSANGQRAAYALERLPGNGVYDVFVRDFMTSEVKNLGPVTGTSGNMYFPGLPLALSPDGNKLAINDSNSTYSASPLIFLADWNNPGGPQIISTSTTGTVANAPSENAVFSLNGQYLFFISSATNLTVGSSNSPVNIFRKHLGTGVTDILPLSLLNQPTTAGGSSPSSPDGNKVIFFSSASNLEPDDTNGLTDTFIRYFVYPNTAAQDWRLFD